MRRLLGWIPGLITLGLLLSQARALSPASLSLGYPRWLVIAILVHIVAWYLLASVFRWSLRAVDVESRPTALLPVLFSSFFLIATGRRAAAAPLMVGEAEDRGQEPVRAAAGVLLARLIDVLTFGPLLVCGIVVLLHRHMLGPLEALVLTLVIAVATALAVNASGLPAVVATLASATNRLSRFLGRPAPWPDTWLERGSPEMQAAVHAAHYHPLYVARAAVFGLAQHLFGMFSLYAIFRAFGVEVGIATVITGHGLGLLSFAFITVPAASGFIETTLALAFYLLEIPLDVAVLAAVIYRVLWFWLPVLFGALVMRGAQRYGAAERSNAELGAVRFGAFLVWVMGVANVASAMLPAFKVRMGVIRALLPQETTADARMTSIVLGFALIMLAGSIWRRKRAGWVLSLVALGASAVVHLLKGLDVEFSLMAAGIALWLYHLGPHFHARSDAPSVSRGLRSLVLSVAFVLVYGVAGFWLLSRHYAAPFDMGDALRETVVLATQLHDPQAVPVTGFGRFFVDSISVVGAFAMLYALLMVLRPVLPRGLQDAAARERARSIVEQWGCSTMAHFTLLSDKTYFFSEGGSVVAYAVKGRHAVVLADPIGPPADLGATVRAFRDFAAANDWEVTYYQTRPDTLEVYKAEGYDVLCIGEEGVVDVRSFTTSGKAGASLRTAMNRLKRLGYRTELHPPPIAPPLLAELRRISDEWLTRMHGTEKHFSLGAFEDDYVASCPIMAVHAPDGTVVAFANIIPEYRLNEMTIDMMRRRSEIENGTMDVLFVALLEHARERGFDTFNLGLSPLAGVGDEAGDPLAERAMHYIYENLNQLYSFMGLHAFKEKWHPAWVPRYLVLPGMASLPGVAVALIRVHSGDTFLLDYCRDLLSHRHVETRPAGNISPPDC